MTTIAVVGFITPAAAVLGGSLAAQVHPQLVRHGSVTGLASPSCSSSAFCASTIDSAYSLTGIQANASSNGTGQTVVIVDACGDANIATDLTTFDAAMGLSDPTLTVYQPQGTPCSDPFGWGLESALDVEWAHVIAPGASIALVEAKSATNGNLFGAWNYSLVHKLGNQISNSWGGSGACPSQAKTLLTAAAKARVTVLASSGDGGAWGSGTRQTIQYPADCQTVLAVGGTSLSVTSSGAYSSESAWSGSGGGYSQGTTEPTYQTKANITDTYTELGKPDVAAVADPSTGVWVYEKGSGGWVVVGGTSVACPIWAGFVADVNSWRAVNLFVALGSVDPFLYNVVYGVNGGSSNYGADIHDVTTGSNGWSAGTGWDAATGIGSFNGGSLASLLASSKGA